MTQAQQMEIWNTVFTAERIAEFWLLNSIPSSTNNNTLTSKLKKQSANQIKKNNLPEQTDFGGDDLLNSLPLIKKAHFQTISWQMKPRNSYANHMNTFPSIA